METSKVTQLDKLMEFQWVWKMEKQMVLLMEYQKGNHSVPRKESRKGRQWEMKKEMNSVETRDMYSEQWSEGRMERSRVILTVTHSVLS